MNDHKVFTIYLIGMGLILFMLGTLFGLTLDPDLHVIR